MDTIAAISTPLSPGALGVVRLSGEEAPEIAGRVFAAKSGKRLADVPGYTCLFGEVYDRDGTFDTCVATRFRAPKSYTGEYVVELSCHGGPAVLRRLLAACYAAGARAAKPGEFTRRAFLNGKMDLTQAESVMEMVSAEGASALQAAHAGMEGKVSARITKLRDKLLALDAHLAAWADFPDEGIEEVEGKDLFENLRELEGELSALLSEFDAGQLLRGGVRTVLAGRPNVGKSTLMNLLSGYEKSIVTSYPGTTRDVVEERVFLGDVPLLLADTAGLRDADDPVEQLGVARTRQKLSGAQLILAVFDASQPLTEEDEELVGLIGGTPCVAVLNKNDLPSLFPTNFLEKHFKTIVTLSAKSGEGFQDLQKAVKEVLHLEKLDPNAGVLFTQRQRAAVERAKVHVHAAAEALAGGMTLDGVTIDVESALSAFYELTGEKASEAVIDTVFETFCVGK